MTKPAPDKETPAARSTTVSKSDAFDSLSAFMAPTSVQATEDDSESAWVAFQNLQTEDEIRWSTTVPGALLETIRTPPHGAAGDAIVWTDDLVTGFKGMDEDHKVWIALANEALAATDPSAPRAHLRTAVDKLALYSNDHFHRENQAMKGSGYPLAQVHMAAHAAMMKKILEFRHQLVSNLYLDPKELQDFILTWLPNHIIRVDKGLARFLSNPA